MKNTFDLYLTIEHRQIYVELTKVESHEIRIKYVRVCLQKAMQRLLS